MKSLFVTLIVGTLCTGCTLLAPDLSKSLLNEADAKLEAKDYRSAVALYSEFLKTNLQDPQAARTRATQAALGRLLALQTELERVQLELSDRQNETGRLKGEVAKLRTDIERLRNIDLKELQRGPKK